MTDIFSKEKRSSIMSTVKGKGSKIEKRAATIFRKNRISYRSQPKGFSGKPDFSLPQLKTVVFIDSCFWHGCKRHGTQPKSNSLFWRTKIARNKKRDKEINRIYKKKNLRMVRIWEHSLTDTSTDRKILSALDKLSQKMIQ